MKSFCRPCALFLAITYPLATSGQHHHNGNGSHPGGFPGSNSQTTAIVVVAAVVKTEPAAVTTNNPVVVAINPVVVNTNPAIVNTRSGGGGIGNPTTTTAGPVSTGGGGGGGGAGGSCAAVDGNMNIQVSGTNVDFRFEPPAVGNPTTGNTGDCRVWTLPLGWNGRIHVGGDAGSPVSSTLFEANLVNSAAPAMDVSFVEAYSVPMICTDNGNGHKSGCGIDLFGTGTPCPTGGSGSFCKNPQGPGGARDSAKKACWACSPPDPFFGPCAAAAFTFPTDDDANDGVSSLDISCAIGESSVRTGREGNTAATGHPEAGRCKICTDGTKRSLEAMLFGRELVSPIARAPSMLPRVHKKSVINVLGKRSHQHGIAAHEGKIR